jgi:hypothetical protein
LTDTIVELQPVRSQPDQPTFTRAADATLERVRNTYITRGDAYGDSWALPNMHHRFTEHVLSLRRDLNYPAWLRLLRAAVLVDTKGDRIQGGGSVDDHLLDGVAYELALAQFLVEHGER